MLKSLRRHFSSIQSPDPPNHKINVTPVPTKFRFTTISEQTVLKKLASINVKKATGPDGISAKLLKMVAPAISPSLTSLFNYSLSQGKFPAAWKEANVTPVPKSGDKHFVNNYRPISVIPIVAKVLESFVHD